MRYHLLLLAAALLPAAAGVSTAQPPGWPCDYAYRPGNTWFYRMMSPPGSLYKEWIERDSVGADGAYWVYRRTYDDAGGVGSWLRIDSACVIDIYSRPEWPSFYRTFMANADSGDSWRVDTTHPPDWYWLAEVNDIYMLSVFGRTVRVKEIVYYEISSVGKGWYYAAEYAESIGIISTHSHPFGHDQLVGAIIDGRAYGDVSGVDAPAMSDAQRVGVHPVPASTSTTLAIDVHGERYAAVRLHDMLGRVVQRRRLDDLHDGMNTIGLDVRELPPGHYLIVVDIGGARHTAPLVVVR